MPRDQRILNLIFAIVGLLAFASVCLWSYAWTQGPRPKVIGRKSLTHMCRGFGPVKLVPSHFAMNSIECEYLRVK